MTTQVIVDTLDDVQEDLKKHYKLNEEDQKFHLDVDPLINALSKTKESKSTMQSRAEQLEAELAATKEKLGKVDVDKYSKLLELEAEMSLKKEKEAEEKAKREGDIVALEKQYQEKLAAERAELEAKLEEQVSLNGKIKQKEAVAKKNADVLTAMQNAEVINPHFIEHQVNARIRTEMSEDGNYRSVVVDAEGKPMKLFKDDKLVDATIADVIAELKQDNKWGAAFAPSKMSGVNSGGGASSGDGAARQITQAEFQAASGEKWLTLRNDIVSGKIKLIES